MYILFNIPILSFSKDRINVSVVLHRTEYVQKYSKNKFFFDMTGRLCKERRHFSIKDILSSSLCVLMSSRGCQDSPIPFTLKVCMISNTVHLPVSARAQSCGQGLGIGLR